MSLWLMVILPALGIIGNDATWPTSKLRVGDNISRNFFVTRELQYPMALSIKEGSSQKMDVPATSYMKPEGKYLKAGEPLLIFDHEIDSLK